MKSSSNKKYKLAQKLTPYMHIAPALIGILLFTVYPMIKVVYLSLFKTNLIHPEKTVYVGLANFTKMFGSSAFKMSIKTPQFIPWL